MGRKAKPKPPRKLTEKQELFCREYLIDRKALAAYRRAGYKTENAQANPSRELKKPHIRERIRELAREAGIAAIDEALFRSENNGEDTRGMTLEEAVDVRRHSLTDDNWRQKLDAALITLERTQAEIACAALSDRTQMFDEKGALIHPKDWPPHMKCCFDSVKYTPNGFEYKMISKVEALKLLGQSLNMFADHEKNKQAKVEIVLHPDDLKC